MRVNRVSGKETVGWQESADVLLLDYGAHCWPRNPPLFCLSWRALPSPRQTPFVPKFAKLHAITAASRNSLACFKSRHWTRGEVNTADPIVSSSLLVSPRLPPPRFLLHSCREKRWAGIRRRDEISMIDIFWLFYNFGIILKLLLDGWKTSSLREFPILSMESYNLSIKFLDYLVRNWIFRKGRGILQFSKFV